MISTDKFLPPKKGINQTSITPESIDLEKSFDSIVYGKVLTLVLKNSSDMSSAKLVGFLKFKVLKASDKMNDLNLYAKIYE